MATKTPSTEGASDAGAPASAGKVRVRWTGAKVLAGIRQQRIIGKYTWESTGLDEGPVIEMDADAWAELTPEQRKADGFEEVP